MPSTGEATTIDFNHPLYLHPSDTSGSPLISHQLTGVENYTVWSRSMQIVFLVKNKLGFVDGSCARDKFQSLEAQWDRCNAIVLSWIINSISHELSAVIVFTSTVALVWTDLQERFHKIDSSRVFFLHWEIAIVVQGDASILVYFTRMKLLWDEYVALVPSPTCNCENGVQNRSHASQQRLFQFLMSLNETYASVRSQILLMQPLPSVNGAYSMLIQEESYRLHTSIVAPDESTVLLSNSANSRKCFSGHCDYCKVKGNKKESCYRLIGFPPDFKFNKKKGVTSASSNSVDGSSDSGAHVITPPAFTTDQYNRILELLNHP